VRRERGARAAAVHYLQGLLMGSADIIPGVSGGTMALIVGIYERLIASIRNVAGAAISLVRLRGGEARERLAAVEWWLVIPLGLGVLTALKVGAMFIPGLLERYPEGSRALFFGLIAASIPIPWRRRYERRPAHAGVAVGAAVVAFLLVGLPPREVLSPPLIAVFLAAAVAICAMILPGVSGSFLLYVMGIYTATLTALNAMDLTYIVVFAAGAAIGLGAFAKLLDFLLRNHHDTTMAALVGLMAGSLRALWPWQAADRTLLMPPADGSALTALALAVVGFVAVSLLVHFGRAAEHRGTPLPDRG
jgi:putative membrane protein